ncbi:hypothetical protein MTBBW1_2030079 [Desulfamplus magnetovallimortis]|uniref:SGNH hydrolase-type esterase domain-containing protein n=1 Tax=Desulfamplus magnetovallimortis TaxID=1246637 RepID=A0A1W1HC13_9BACT|nr:SGNH/GDSL hydrolase family protein [Desulfamplus magnetovallimortis]SLM29989.1 hypothetical protein MTBBW1_2030079 [Desulfamplus magnetovallimortis]
MSINRKKHTLYTFSIIVTIFIIILAGEILARIFVQEYTIPYPPEIKTIDPYSSNPFIFWSRQFLHSHIPHAQYYQARSYYKVKYNINSSGFRGYDISTKKKGWKRIAIIGDSIVEGHGCEIEDTFTYSLNEKAYKYSWEVINFGVQGASPLYYALNLQRYLSANPDAVMIVLFENDIHDDRIQEKNYFKQPFLDNPDALFPGDKNPELQIVNRSKMYILMRRGFHNIFKNHIEQIILENNTFNILNNEQEELNRLSPWLVAPSMFDQQWQMSSLYLDIIVEALKKKEIPLYVVFLALGALSPEKDSAYKKHVMDFNQKVESWSHNNQTTFISLVPLAKKLFVHYSPTDIMIVNDGHPTPKTHQIISEYLWSSFLADK